MPSPLHFLSNLIVQSTLALSLSLSLSFFNIPVLFLQGLHTYIHPDDVNPSGNGVKAAIRRPGVSDQDIKPRKKSKDKFEFDENKAQIFRLRLSDGHLQTRIYFKEFSTCFNSTFVALSCLLVQNYLSLSDDAGFVSTGAIIPILLGFVCVFRLLILISRVSFERSASRRSDKQLSVALGFLGFILGLVIVLQIAPIFDFGLGSLDGIGKLLVAVFMGCIGGFLFMPSATSARAFWLGTDQIRCNLSIIYCGWIGRMLLYVNYLVIVFTSLLWINPFADLLINNQDNRRGSKMMSNADELVGNLGVEQSDFNKFRLWCLLVSGVLQIITLRPNLQMYLNEAVLSWYQRLHASKMPDLDFSRAKVFLHNHYLCLVVLQFFAPPAMLLLFLGLSQIDGNLFKSVLPVSSLLPYSTWVKQVTLLMAWWINFVWAIFMSASLVLYRRGSLYVT